MKVKRVSLSSLSLDAQNTRVHDARNCEAIRNSLEQFGQAEPLVVQAGTGRVIGGNGRLVVMQQMGWTDCDVVEVDVDNLQATALSVALNRTSDLASWDDEDLALVLDGLDKDMREAAGFNEDEVNRLLDDLGKAVDREAQVPQNFRVVVECDDEEQQRQLVARFETEGLRCRPVKAP